MLQNTASRGILLTLTPDWRSNYVKFFDDYTHVRPFSCVSLKNIYLASGYENVNIDSFKQLPYYGIIHFEET